MKRTETDTTTTAHTEQWTCACNDLSPCAAHLSAFPPCAELDMHCYETLDGTEPQAVPDQDAYRTTDSTGHWLDVLARLKTQEFQPVIEIDDAQEEEPDVIDAFIANGHVMKLEGEIKSKTLTVVMEPGENIPMTLNLFVGVRGEEIKCYRKELHLPDEYNQFMEKYKVSSITITLVSAAGCIGTANNVQVSFRYGFDTFHGEQMENIRKEVVDKIVQTIYTDACTEATPWLAA